MRRHCVHKHPVDGEGAALHPLPAAEKEHPLCGHAVRQGVPKGPVPAGQCRAQLHSPPFVLVKSVYPFLYKASDLDFSLVGSFLGGRAVRQEIPEGPVSAGHRRLSSPLFLAFPYLVQGLLGAENAPLRFYLAQESPCLILFVHMLSVKKFPKALFQ